MIREDYIFTMIRQLGELVRRILNQDVSNENVEAELDALSGEWIGLPKDLLLALPTEEAYRLFEESERMVAEKSYVMAEVCRAKGLISKISDDRRHFFEKALFFYGKCSGFYEEKVQNEIDAKIADLIEQTTKPD